MSCDRRPRCHRQKQWPGQVWVEFGRGCQRSEDTLCASRWIRQIVMDDKPAGKLMRIVGPRIATPVAEKNRQQLTLECLHSASAAQRIRPKLVLLWYGLGCVWRQLFWLAMQVAGWMATDPSPLPASQVDG